MTFEASQSFSVEIQAPIQLCFATITDFAAYPLWSRAVKRATVLERDAHGQASRVEFELEILVKSLRYVLEYCSDPPRALSWKLVEGDLEAVEGSYVFQELNAHVTRATCTQAVALGFWLPGPLRRMMERQALKDSVEEFKREAERRAALPKAETKAQ